jgi:peptide/nickel transport system substrate-binding protein
MDGLPLPYADRATVRFGLDGAARLAEMRAGRADWIGSVPGADRAAARKIRHARLVDAALAGVTWQVWFNTASGPFKESQTLRQAFSHAIDRAALARELGGGLGIPLPYALAPGTVGYDTAVPTYAYDPERARRLLAESGVRLPLDVRLAVRDHDLDRRQGRALHSMLEQVGVRLTPEALDRAAWTERVRAGGDFELAVRPSPLMVDPIHELLLAGEGAGGTAGAHAMMPGVLERLRQADAATDEPARHRLLVEAQTLLHESAAGATLWFENGSVLAHTRLNMAPPGRGALREAEWWIDG